MTEGDYFRPVSMNNWASPYMPDRNLTWMYEIVHEWDRKRPADLGIVGLPFDGAVVNGRQGARLGPKGVRDTL